MVMTWPLYTKKLGMRTGMVPKITLDVLYVCKDLLCRRSC